MRGRVGGREGCEGESRRKGGGRKVISCFIKTHGH